ncbi:hypothetical protein ACFSC6_12065 [Rufibacter sediminis]|uniref:Uncharacterized protein n=1 Tax=Rufibacter sediminis TaxID=2762756 RepID=A0ABR6VTR8_9BACT|nr:hypothetical protein [Rufibacter sediminis]MBC3540617.1 hypothetical protein [Rufibacter sediminis]
MYRQETKAKAEKAVTKQATKEATQAMGQFMDNDFFMAEAKRDYLERNGMTQGPVAHAPRI